MFKRKRKTSKIFTVQSPTGGWNVKDPISDMPVTDAVILDNCFCRPSDIQIRKGYTSWATGISGNAETIFEYSPPSGAAKVFAASNNSGTCQFYDISTAGAVGGAVVSGLTSAQIRTASFTNSGGSFLHCVNGSDSLRLYDGATWYTVTGISATYAITGVATTSLTDVVLHKRRLWFVEKNTMSCWYLAGDAIAGAATKYDFGPIFSRGGHIVKIDTWTLDAGTGVDDHFAVFTSEGEVAVYSGTDPASITTWALSGVFYIGTPTGTVGHTCKYGGDLLIINKDGIAQMSKSLMSSRVNTHLQLTEKIQPQLASDNAAYYANSGWDILLFPPQNMLLVNIPISSTESYQYVVNTISGGWSRWTGVSAKCWRFANETLFFGGVGAVYRMWDGQNDNGSLVRATILPAYQTFGSDGQLKRWSMARVIFGLDQDANYGAEMMVDFDQNTQVIALPAQVPANLFTWDVSEWDSDAVWGGNIYTDRKWQSVSGMGYWGSLQIQIESMSADVRVYSIDYSVEGGGVL